MIERLTFNHGTAFLDPGAADNGPPEGRRWDDLPSLDAAPVPAPAGPPRAPDPIDAEPGAAMALAPAPAFRPAVARPDLAYWGACAFTALLFFRPQDTLTVLGPLHLSEAVAIVALIALLVSRIGAGLPPVQWTPELTGVILFAVVMVGTAPFAIWPGGALNALVDVYLKVVLIFILLTHSIRSPAMLRRICWLVVLAMGYVALRGVLDYARGLNLDRGRLHGPVSGMMGNPNDLAMNMVTFLPLAFFLALGRGRIPARLLAAVIALLMTATIVFTRSRGAMLGLAVMGIVLIVQAGRFRPVVLGAVLVGTLVAVPVMPSSVWTRLSSIVNAEEDETGSREARKELMLQGWRTFVERPLTGVGLDQFKNYNPPGRSVQWQETHNVLLQVLAELGILGGAVFVYLLARAVAGLRRTKHLVPPDAARRRRSPSMTLAALAFRPDEREWMQSHRAALAAGFAGWFTCAQFASVGYYWTFYYLLAFIVAGREIAAARVEAVRRSATGEDRVAGHAA